MRRRRQHASALPGDLVEALSRARNACELTWREARAKDDFAMLAEPLAAVVSLSRQAAQVKGEALGCDPYDALLDLYEAGLRAEAVDRCFDILQARLPAMIDAALERQASRTALPLQDGIGPSRQEALSRELVAAVGLADEHGRLDVSHHPFTGGVPDDVRLTTRYDEADPLPALMAALHEAGHAMYERGLPRRWRNQPVGTAMGMAVHESQSLIVEMQAARSQPFVEHLARRMRELWQVEGEPWQAANLGRLVRRVARSYIRVDADELTYPLHIILRYQLERALLSDRLAVRDLPEAWRAGMQELVGTAPPTDREGCLQDLHWPDGDFGYFPTYTLGAVAAAQLMNRALDDHPEIPEALSRGDFSPLMGWLRQHVHARGAYPETLDALLIEVTGRPLDTEGFLQHLHRRYLDPAH
jgi:carboxypeptidase Taq